MSVSTGVVNTAVLVDVSFVHHGVEIAPRQLNAEVVHCLVQLQLGDVAVAVVIKHLNRHTHNARTHTPASNTVNTRASQKNGPRCPCS